MALKDNLPEFIAEEKYTEEVLNAIEPEIDKLKIRLSNVLLETCISTCTKDGVERFEKDYFIKCNPKITLDLRRRRVINKMIAKKCLTKDGLTTFIKRNIDNSQFYISNLAEDYKFKVMITDFNYRDKLYNALFYARPCHLIFEIELVKYQRRCGTFNCNQEVK